MCIPLISTQAQIISHFCEFPCMSTARPSQAIKEGDADAKASDRQSKNMIWFNFPSFERLILQKHDLVLFAQTF